jgi:hypothetical protein
MHRKAVEDTVPLPIARLIHSQHPYFFGTAPTRLEVMERLMTSLQCTRSLNGEFDVHFQREAEEVTVWLVWSGDPEKVFIAAGVDAAEALFRATMQMMDHPRFAPFFAELIRPRIEEEPRQSAA